MSACEQGVAQEAQVKQQDPMLLFDAFSPHP
jgi:hypothetical protein